MQSNMTSSAMRSGLILGVLFSANFFISVSGIPALGLLSYLLVGLIVFYTYRFTVHFRDTELEGAISFARAFLYVLLMCLFASVISSFAKYFYLKFSKSTFLEDMYNQNITTLEQIMPAAVTDEMYDAVEMLTNPQGYTMMTAWTNMILALIIALIIAGIVKKDKSPF